MYFARSFRFAAAALMLSAATQGKAAPVTYGTYYDEQEVNTGCLGAASCRVNFSQLPSDKLLMLSRVNCIISSNQPILAVQVRISPTLGGNDLGRGVAVNPGPPAIAGSFYFYSFEADARLLIGQARFPFIQASTNATNASVTCGIVGDLVTPIP